MDLIKLKSFYTAKETIVKMKRKPTEWGETFANGKTKLGLKFNMYKQFIQLNIKNINNPVFLKGTAFSKVKVSTILPRFILVEVI